jgi:hypothetical protein
MRNAFLISLLAVVFAFAGCQAGWQSGGSTYTADKNAFSIQVPAGWYYTSNLGPVRAADLFATKDGIYLQRLIVDHHAIKDPLPNSKRTVTNTMSPFEIAEAVVDDFRSDHALLHFEINDNTPAVVGGRPGFRLLMRYRNQENLQLAELRYGALVGDRIYFVRFVAPARHYFDQDVAAFEAAARTFQLPSH